MRNFIVLVYLFCVIVPLAFFASIYERIKARLCPQSPIPSSYHETSKDGINREMI